MNNEEIAALDFSAWRAPDEFLTEIGRVSVLWASLDSFLNTCIGKLAGFNDQSDPKPFILLVHSSFPQRLDILGTLCEQLQSEFPQLADYKRVVSLLKAAQTTRNHWAHNGIFLDPESHSVTMAFGSARGKLRVTVKTVKLEDIKQAVVEIDEANRALYRLVLRRELSPAWTHKTNPFDPK